MADYTLQSGHPFPAALEPYAREKRWVVWRMETDKSGKPTKVPYQPDHPEWKAKSNDANTWSDLDTAIEVAERDGFEGIGLELHEGEIGAFDVDKCRDSESGEIEPKVMELVARCGSYTEITPSGTGLRIIGNYMGEPSNGRKASLPGANGVTIEPYPACKRFITVTGDHLDGTPDELADITAVIDEVLARLGKKSKPKDDRDHSPREDADELPRSLTLRLFIPDEGAGKPHAGYPTRSDLMFAFIADAIRARVGAKRIAEACLDSAHKGHAIHEHCHDNGGEQYVMRQIEQARAKIHAAQETLTDLGNARRLVRYYGSDLRYVPEWFAWMSWVDGHWKRNNDGAAMRFAKATVEQMHTEAIQISDENRRTALRAHAIKSQSRERLYAMVKLAESELDVIVHTDNLDADPLLLGVKNGIVDLRTVEFREATREDYVTKIAGATYDARAQCPHWLEFLGKIIGSPRMIDYIQRATGYLLTGLTDEEVMFVLWGLARAGKSTFRETLFALLGEYAIASDASLLIVSKRPGGGGATPDLVRLHGRRLVTVNETEQNAELNEQRVKFITSHDMITARGLYEAFVDFKPSHKTFLTTNHKPIIKGTDDGIWRRVQLWPFTVTIPQEESDPGYREKRLLPELPGILNWALDGLRAYWREGLNPPRDVTEATKEYREEMDLIGMWIDERCQLDPEAEEITTILHADYADWARREVGFAKTTIGFGRELTERGFKRAKVKGKRGIRGLRLSPVM
jgi:putative DNA primase/helicase